MSQPYRIAEVRRDPWRSSSPMPLPKAQSTRAGPSGQRPIEFRVVQKRETPQPLRVTCSSPYPPSQLKSFFLCLNEISYISICARCPLSIHWILLRKSGCTFFTSSYQVFVHIYKICNYAQFYPLCFHTVYKLQP